MQINVNKMLGDLLPWTDDDTIALYESITTAPDTGDMRIINQAKALNIISGGEDWKLIPLIKLYGKTFRDLINRFKEKHGIIPSPDDFIAHAARVMGEDPIEVAKLMKPTLEDQIYMR